MSNAAPGSTSFFFYNREQIVDHLLQNVLANTQRKVGTEWEMFFVNRETGDPITRVDGRQALIEMREAFTSMGYEVQDISETAPSGARLVGLKIIDIGAIVPEAGLQFEFACAVSENCAEIFRRNEAVHKVINIVTARLGYRPVFSGHLPGWAEKTEGMDRSRCEELEAFQQRMSDSKALSEYTKGTASVQATVDAGAENFHEFFRALLLIEPALTLYYANSDRSHVAIEAYSELIPSQVNPITSVWNTVTPREALEAIVDRLMDVEVQFLPDPEKPNGLAPEAFRGDRPPTVREIMQEGRLSEKALNNIGTFFYTRPAMRNFFHALLEVRGVDTQESPELVTEIAGRVTAILYNDDVRRELLADYAHFTEPNIQELHRAASMKIPEAALDVWVGETQMLHFVADIIARSDRAMPSRPVHKSEYRVAPKITASDEAKVLAL